MSFPEIVLPCAPLDALVRRHGSPLLVLDRARLVRRYQAFRAFQPGVRPYYRVQTNPHPDVLRLFDASGCSFAVADEEELRLVLELDIAAEKIFFASPVKRQEALQFARSAGVDLVGFDSFAEASKIAKVHPGCRVLAEVGRDSEVAARLVDQARSLGLRVEGVRVAFDAPPFAGADVGTVALTGVPLRLPRGRFDGERTWLAEIGDALVGPAGLLVTRVVARTRRGERPCYYLDVADLADATGVAFRAGAASGPTRESLVTGPTGTDAVPIDLPELAPGDLVVARNLGDVSRFQRRPPGGFAATKVVVV